MLILNDLVDTCVQWESCPEVQDPTCPQTAYLHTHTVLHQVIHYFFQDRRVWEQNPTASRSSQEYIVLLRGKKRGGECESKWKTWQVKTQGGLRIRSNSPRNCWKKPDGKESIIKGRAWGKWGDHVSSMSEIERDGEKLVVTRTTHCADCKWRVLDQSFPPLIHRAIVLHCLLAFPQHEYITSHTMTLLIVYELLACLTTKAIFIRKL